MTGEWTNPMIYEEPLAADWAGILKRPDQDSDEIRDKVKAILMDVKQRGNNAIRQFTNEFDGVELRDFRVTDEQIATAETLVPSALKDAIEIAIQNITQFHLLQIPEGKGINTMEGIHCSYRYLPIQKVGLYVPGGTAPLFSTLMMLAIPAKFAGCEQIIVCTPCDKEGKVHPAILYIAKQTGIKDIFKIGGAQAIAALAYGTDTIPAVHKIFGPGNRYVTTAKQLVTNDGVAIDMPAGPSEVAVYADETARPEFVAADLLSQAEHGPDSQVVLVATSPIIVEKILQGLKNQLDLLPRKLNAVQALKNSRFIVCKKVDDAFDLLNEYAPEHLIIASDNAEILSQKVVNAGSVFLGHYSPESAGDYATGTNHTLPTFGYAKNYSGVGVESFLKKITFQQLSREGLQKIGPAVEEMAAAEGLEAHRKAISIRLNYLNNEF